MARSILVFSDTPGSGKTAVAAGLAHRLNNLGRQVLLIRVGEAGDEQAAADARFYGSLPYGAGSNPLGLTQAASMSGEVGSTVLVAELPAGADAPRAADKLDAVAIGIAPVREPDWDRLKGTVGFAPDSGGSLSTIGEESLFSAPTVREVLEALPATARVSFLSDGGVALCERVVIAPISHDTGRIYFSGEGEAAVVCRDDKPEVALSALAGNTSLLVVTGGDQPLGYVLERAIAAGIPVALTPEGTVATARRLESIFRRRPVRHLRQVERMARLMEAIDLDELLR
jgi:BioD-like phosphotransacetylase family protein